jgi:flagellar motor switch protein FliG
MNSNKKIAALLWVLIPPKYRINIEKYLSKQEIEELKNTFKEYKKLSPEEKLKIQTMLHKVFISSYKFLYLCPKGGTGLSDNGSQEGSI